MFLWGKALLLYVLTWNFFIGKSKIYVLLQEIRGVMESKLGLSYTVCLSDRLDILLECIDINCKIRKKYLLEAVIINSKLFFVVSNILITWFLLPWKNWKSHGGLKWFLKNDRTWVGKTIQMFLFPWNALLYLISKPAGDSWCCLMIDSSCATPWKSYRKVLDFNWQIYLETLYLLWDIKQFSLHMVAR